jgi:putative nucleotidyltransferase with HDIG domain
MRNQKAPARYNKYLGKTLNKNILSCTGLLCLPQDLVLTEKHLAFLHDCNIELIDADVEDTVPINKIINQAVGEWKEIFQTAKNSDQIFIRQITDQAVPLIGQLADTYDLHTILIGLHASDDYTYRHSVAVAILTTLIGKWLQLPHEELHQLTTAALLHDIGKTKIPSYILTKQGRLTPEEYKIVKQHTTFGFDMIRNTEGLSDIHARVALEHHERLDGSGYPNGLREETHFLSRIVAVTDVFHAMLSKRPYKDAFPFYQVVKEMYDGAFGLFDPEIVTLFTQRAMEALIGNEVKLSNGQTGKVIQIRSHDLWKPLILCNDQFIDLALAPSLHIEQI